VVNRKGNRSPTAYQQPLQTNCQVQEDLRVVASAKSIVCRTNTSKLGATSAIILTRLLQSISS
jgi:hypothetical protein